MTALLALKICVTAALLFIPAIYTIKQFPHDPITRTLTDKYIKEHLLFTSLTVLSVYGTAITAVVFLFVAIWLA